MFPTEKYLIPHNIFEEKSFDEYCSKIPEFYFKKEVPEDVVMNFQIVEKLLALSYYEYKFIDEAYAKALHTFEMAMNFKMKEINPDSKSKSFKPLIAKLTKLKHFETRLNILEHLEYMRNFYSHPERHSFGGVGVWNRIEHISRLINEMYEDVELRKERVSLSKNFVSELENANLNKALVIEIKGEPTMLYSLTLLFINNKENPHTYLFAFIPLFDLETTPGGSIRIPMAHKSKLVAPTITNNILHGTSFSFKEEITFRPISDYPELKKEFDKWNEEFDKAENKFLYELNLTHYFNEIYIPEIQQFQRM